MGRFAALLRGVNVGRGNRVPMMEFRALLESLGCTEVGTLLNSGNAAFTSSARSCSILATAVRKQLKSRLEIDVPVIVKSLQEIGAIEAENRLAGSAADHSRLLVAFAPDPEVLRGLAALAPLVKGPERFQLGKHAAYLLCPDGILASQAAGALLGKLGRSSTTRNWATVLKLSALLRDPAAARRRPARSS